MKPVQSSVSEVAGDLLPAFASKAEATPGESFQAALALALQGIKPTVKVEQMVVSGVKAVNGGTTLNGEQGTALPVPAAPIAASHSPLPVHGSPSSSVQHPPSSPVSRSPVPVSHHPSPPVPRSSETEPAKPSDPTSPPDAVPAEVMAIVAAVVAPKTASGEQAPAVLAEGDAAPEPKLQARTPDAPRAVKPVVIPSGTRSVPVAEPRKPAEREDTDAQTPPKESPAESRHVDRTEPTPVPARVRVTVEETNVEGKAAVAPPPVKDRKLQRDVEAVQHIAESPAGAPHPDGVPAQMQRASHESPATAADAPAQLRHADDAPANPGTLDRVTLHLPDDAGGGRIQIAVRGDVVHARIVSPDDAGTMEMQSGLDELRGALTRQGFQETHVRVETRPVSDAGWMPASAAREAAGAGDSRPHDSERHERQARDQRQPEEAADQRRQQADGRSHQRSRRERER